ncbi:MAG TPA: hypothetical protein V6C71_14840 [Coleofasciculaceae cyanobacterium]
MLQAAIKPVYLSIFRYSLIFKKTYGLLLVIVCSLSSYPVLAQAANGIAINQNIISQPLIIKGTSGGTVRATEITQTENTATGYCNGYVRSQANHLLKLESFLEFMRLEVASPADTTILVKGPDGVWCNDDAGTANPMIEGQWQQGLYQVWVGSYQVNTSNNYQIKITGR